MIHSALIDTLTFKSEFMAKKWSALIRETPHLKHYNTMSEDDLVAMNAPVYRQLASALEHGIDRNVLGDFFVRMGKDRQFKGFPLSETVFACNLSQQMAVDLIVSEMVMDNPLALYKALEVVNVVTEFYFCGLFYLIKGYLETTYTQLSTKHKVPENLLKEFFKDDFFFKKE